MKFVENLAIVVKHYLRENMKKTLFILLALITYSTFALIGDTPYTIAQNLKKLNCGPLSSYVTGTTKIEGNIKASFKGLLTISALYSAWGTMKINTCTPMGKLSFPEVCANFKIAKNPGLWIDKEHIENQDAAIALVKDKADVTVPFEACVLSLYQFGGTGLAEYFGSSRLQDSIIISVHNTIVMNQPGGFTH